MIRWPLSATRALVSVLRRAPLHGLRLVATLPPGQFFGGNNLLRARAQIAALRSLGAAVYEFDTQAVYANDRATVQRQASEIVEFRPDAAIGTPHAGYVVQGGMCDRPAGRRNLFIDELELPTILFWDHALTQAAHYLLYPWPESPAQSQDGALATLAAFFHGRNVVHLLPDTGHARELERLNIAPFPANAWYVQGVDRAFVQAGQQADREAAWDEDVAFFGNIYLAGSRQVPYSSDVAIVEFRRKARAACAADWNLPPFEAYSRMFAALDQGTRAALCLVPDQSFYWRFLFDELARVMNADDRLAILQSCGRPVAYYGNFNDPASDALMAGTYRVRGALPYDDALARAFRRTRITIDAANACFINGFSVKPMACFASGGFALTNRRADLGRALGSVADEICFDTRAELTAKVENFLADDRKRTELTREIGSMIRRDYTSEALFARTIPAALDMLKRSAFRRMRRPGVDTSFHPKRRATLS
jgi:hypothetical protein